ncbi:hypothetical protein [Anaplasma phagocytophilum]|uniref:hypothetical protein n=1 Tax=Anaplasma phagocytophilum TaxID=948 RepID=UPI00201AA3A9
MLSRINKGLGFQVFEGSTDEGPNNKLPSLHIPESARNLGVVVGVCCFAVLLFSSLLYVVYWISMALCVVSALFLFIDYVVAASAYLAASKDFLPFISTPEDRLQYSEYILKKRHGEDFHSEISSDCNDHHPLDNLAITVPFAFVVALLMTLSLGFAAIVAAFSVLPPLLRKGTHNIYYKTAMIVETTRIQEAIADIYNSRAQRTVFDDFADSENLGCNGSMRASFSPQDTVDIPMDEEHSSPAYNHKVSIERAMNVFYGRL